MEMENNSKLSNYSGPAEPSPKARIGNVSDGPRSPDDAYAWSWVDTKKKARKPKRQPKKYVGVKSSGISVDVDGKKAEIKPKKYVSVNKNGFTVDADGNCDKATEEPKRVDKDGISIDEDGFWNDFNERRSFTTKTPPKKSKAEKRKEKKDRLKNIEDFPVFVPQKEDKEFVMVEEEFPTLEIAKTVKKTQVKKKESAPKGPHKERSGVPEETKKGKKVMKKKTDGIKKEDEKKKSLSADDWLLFQELDNIEKANAHEISSHFEENLLRSTLMEELNSMALVAKKNKDLIVEAEALIARKMNRSFKKARRSERLEDLKKTVKSQSHKKLKFLFVGMKDSHIMKIFVQTDELLKAEEALKVAASEEDDKDRLQVEEDVVEALENVQGSDTAVLRLNGGANELEMFQNFLDASKIEITTNLAIYVNQTTPLQKKIELKSRNSYLEKLQQEAAIWIKTLEERDFEKEFDIKAFRHQSQSRMHNSDVTQCFMIVVLRMIIASDDFRDNLGQFMEISDSYLMRILRLCHVKDNQDNFLAALRALIYAGREHVGNHEQFDAMDFLSSFFSNDEISTALSSTDYFTKFKMIRSCSKQNESCSIRPEDNEDPILHFRLPLEKKSIEMQSLIDDFQNDSVLVTQCNGCQEDTPFNERKTFTNLPKHLYIAVGRSWMAKDKNGEYKPTKIMTRISNSQQIKFQHKIYHLVESVLHIGRSALAGHYLSVSNKEKMVYSDQFSKRSGYYLNISEYKRQQAIDKNDDKFNDWSDAAMLDWLLSQGTLYYYIEDGTTPVETESAAQEPPKKVTPKKITPMKVTPRKRDIWIFDPLEKTPQKTDDPSQETEDDRKKTSVAEALFQTPTKSDDLRQETTGEEVFDSEVFDKTAFRVSIEATPEKKTYTRDKQKKHLKLQKVQTCNDCTSTHKCTGCATFDKVALHSTPITKTTTKLDDSSQDKSTSSSMETTNPYDSSQVIQPNEEMEVAETLINQNDSSEAKKIYFEDPEDSEIIFENGTKPPRNDVNIDDKTLPMETPKRLQDSSSRLTIAFSECSILTPSNKQPDPQPMDINTHQGQQDPAKSHATPIEQILVRHQLEQEMIQQEGAAAEAASNIVYYEGTVDDIIFIGTDKQVEFEIKFVKDIYVLRPNAWIKCFRSTSDETIKGLKSHILLQYEITDTNPVLSYQGTEVPETDKLEDHDGQVMILSNGCAYPDHGGKVWCCNKCRNKEGKMMGSNLKQRFKKSHHNNKSCSMFQENLLKNKTNWGTKDKMDKGARPCGHPEIKGAPKRISKKMKQLQQEKDRSDQLIQEDEAAKERQRSNDALNLRKTQRTEQEEGTPAKIQRCDVKLKKIKIKTLVETFYLHETSDMYYVGCKNDILPNTDDRLDEVSVLQQGVEVPSYREDSLESMNSLYSDSGPVDEDISDQIMLKRHEKFVKDEKQRKRWDAQQLREELQLQRLRARQEKQISRKDDAISLLPNIESATYVYVNDKIPVSAFGRPLPSLHQTSFTLPWMESKNNRQVIESDSDDKKTQLKKSKRKSPAVIELERKNKLKAELEIPDKERNLEIFDAGKKGRGIRATQVFEPNDVLMEYKGRIITKEEAKRENYTPTSSYVFEFTHKGEKMYCDATNETGDYGRLINHSEKNANCYMKVESINQRSRLVILAKKQIKTGEELLYSYGDRSPESLKQFHWLND